MEFTCNKEEPEGSLPLRSHNFVVVDLEMVWTDTGFVQEKDGGLVVALDEGQPKGFTITTSWVDAGIGEEELDNFDVPSFRSRNKSCVEHARMRWV